MNVAIVGFFSCHSTSVPAFNKSQQLPPSYLLRYLSTILPHKVTGNSDSFSNLKSLIVAVVRDEKMTIPSGSFKFEPDDSVFFFVKSKNLNSLLSSLGVSTSNSKRIMIAGASKIGRKVAEELQETMSVRLVDNSKEKAKNVANELGDSIVMNADATDVEFLKNENIQQDPQL